MTTVAKGTVRRTGWAAGVVAAVVVAFASGCKTVLVGGRAQHPPDAVPFNGHWYKVFEGKRSWHEAARLCSEMGGSLACIESGEEQEFIARLAAGRYLSLGGTDEAAEDRWVWVNGSPFIYSCWMTGQPNNYGGIEHFLATYDGGEWIDVADSGDGYWMPAGYICEWEK
jgi:hypothetical protein